MLLRHRTHLLFLSAMLLVPTIAQSGIIDANGTCEVNCPSTPALNPGDSTSGSYSFDFTFANTDTYNVVGSYAASYIDGSTSITFSAIANYIGNGTSSPSGADLLSVDFLQDYTFDGDADGGYSATASLVQSGNAAGSYTESELSYDDQGLGEMGPYFGPGTAPFSSSATLSGLATDPLAADFNFTFFFAAGTVAVPEPASIGFVGLPLLGIFALVLRRRRQTA